MNSHQRALLRVAIASCALFGLSINCMAPSRALRSFEDCEELEEYLKDQYLNPKLVRLNEPMALDDQGDRQQSLARSWKSSMPVLFGCAESAAGYDESSAPASAPEETIERDYTTTNLQEERVDEADFVKNDGDHILVLSRGRLIILDAWPADQTHVVADFAIEREDDEAIFVGAPFTMFFDQDRLVVMSRGGSDNTPVREGDLSVPEGDSVVVSLIDVSQRDDPRLLRRLRLDASYVDARRVGDKVLLITKATLAWPPIPGGLEQEKAREIVEQVELDEILPRVQDQVIGRDATPRTYSAMDCVSTFGAEETDGRTLVLMHSISMSNIEAELDSTAMVGFVNHIYSSDENVYLTSTIWYWGGLFVPRYPETAFHKFAALDGGRDSYQATGAALGEVPGRFAMDEHNGDLRVVVTSTDGELVSDLVVMEQEGIELREVGRAQEIGRHEFVQSVRFFDDIAYVVTYPTPEGLRPQPQIDSSCFPPPPPPPPPGEVTDPLWTVDLSEPHNPRTRGFLEVEGYSTYIHPLGDDHLLTIGIDTDTSNIIRGVALSIFDVANLNRPRLVHRHRLGDGQSISEAVLNHHAFTYFPEHKALAVPVQLVDWDCFDPIISSGLEVLSVDIGSGFESLGRIEQLDMFGFLTRENSSCVDVRRSVMIAEGEEAFVYAVSTGGVSVAEIQDGLPEVTRVQFISPDEEICPQMSMPL